VTAQCFCFVDDTDVIEAGDTVHHSGEDICASVQAAATLWSGGIRATGGAINPEKSFWWHIDFEWDARNGQWRFRRKCSAAPDFNLKIPGLYGDIEPLRRLEPDDSKRTLGVMLLPLENHKAQEAQLVSKAKEWASPATQDIMSPVLQVCLPKSGVCRNFPRSVVFAPVDYQDLGVPHPFGKQVYKHLEMILRHMSGGTKTGAYMDANLQAHRLETGTSFGLLQQDYQNASGLNGYGRNLNLWISTVSDITTADGRYIRQCIWNGFRDDTYRTPYNWPRTVRPGRPYWELWQRTLSRALLPSNGQHHPLRQPLGHWHDNFESWNWLWSPIVGLFHREGAAWTHFALVGSSTTSRRYAPSGSHSVPLSGRDWVLLTGTGLPTLPPSAFTPSILNAWQASTNLCTDYYGWVPDEIEVHGDEAALAHALIQGRLRIISDGSYKNDLGTAAVQLLPKGDSARIVIRCQTPGLPQDQSAYCSELIGLLAGIMAVDWLLQQWFPDLSQRPAISRSPVSWSPRHVYGHLDKSNLFDELTWWEKKNLEVDGMAVDFRKELEAAHQLIPPNPRFFTELAALFVADTKQSRLSDHFIQECVTLPRLRQQWRNRNVISEESENLIDWETLGRAMRSLPAGLQRWITKHWVGMCGTGKFKVYWGLELSAACPPCGEFEDHLHVPRCPAASARDEWDWRVTVLSLWMDIHLTSPAIKHAILLLLQGVHDSSCPPCLISRTIRPAFLAQEAIGCQGLLEGRLASLWLSLQQNYFDETHSCRSVSLWASRLSQQLISIRFYMWEQRNAVQHSDDNVQLRERHCVVNEGIHSQFDMGSADLPPDIRRMLTCRHGVLRKSLVDKEEWLKLLRQEGKDYCCSLRAQRCNLRTIFSAPPS
ncbi:unnamed protein product, partial [Cylindrotheca closterium]